MPHEDFDIDLIQNSLQSYGRHVQMHANQTFTNQFENNNNLSQLQMELNLQGQIVDFLMLCVGSFEKTEKCVLSMAKPQ